MSPGFGEPITPGPSQKQCQSEPEREDMILGTKQPTEIEINRKRGSSNTARAASLLLRDPG